MAFFRKARSEVRAGQAGSTHGSALSSSGLDGSPHTIAGDPDAQQLSRNAVMSMEDQVTQQGLYQDSTSMHPQITNPMGVQHFHDAQTADSLGMNAAGSHDDIMQPSIDDYIRAADGINSYLTYHMSEISELPPWITFDLPENPEQ